MKRTHGAVTSLEPLTITANRKTFVIDEPVEGAALGAIARLTVNGKNATEIEILAIPDEIEAEPARLLGIVAARDEWDDGYVIRALPDMQAYRRKDSAGGPRVRVGDAVAFDVMGRDRIAWNVNTLADANRMRSMYGELGKYAEDAEAEREALLEL